MATQTFGGATTTQQGLAANPDRIVIQGSTMAGCHPVGFQWVTEAKARGATVIHVDPRYTRTSAVVPVRQAARGEAHGSGGARTSGRRYRPALV